jgi:hypothetical protein
LNVEEQNNTIDHEQFMKKAEEIQKKATEHRKKYTEKMISINNYFFFNINLLSIIDLK